MSNTPESLNTTDVSEKNRIKVSDIVALVIACVIAGFLIKIPDLFNICLSDDQFYCRFGGWIVFFGLSLYLLMRKDVFELKYRIISFFAFLIPGLYMLMINPIGKSPSMNLAYLHMPLLMWCFFGMIHMNFELSDKAKRIGYLRFNGDLLALGAVILLAGVLLAGLTIGLFEAIGMKIEEFYIKYIVLWGLVSAPIVATFIIRNFPSVTNKIAPLIAQLFSPLVLITLIIFLTSIPFSGKDLYNDRSFLLVFNMMLLGVMALVVFSVTETSLNRKNRFMEVTLFLLTIAALLIDAYALSAIGYRIASFGFSPNKFAVLGSNVLIFLNLVLILVDLIRVNFRKASIERVENTIAFYLPVYFLWTLIVVFTFPLIFGMK
jgi:hypothetical protein